MEMSALPPVFQLNPKRWIGGLLLLLAFSVTQVIIISYSHHSLSSSSSSLSTTIALSSSIRKNTNKSNINSNMNSPTSTSNTIYGHVHIPKTGGSNLNGLMAAKYDNVCGNKGYSYDAYQFNVRAKRDGITETGKNIDSVSLANKGQTFDRGKPGSGVVEEIGFEDCDYISYETKWSTWPRITNDLELAKYNMTLELHVPCREHIEHLLSMGNHIGRRFNCELATANENGFQSSINHVYMMRKKKFKQRFTSKSYLFYKNQIQIQKHEHNHKQNHPNTTYSSNNSNESINLKCFKPLPLDPYLKYMGQQGRLRHRRFESSYVMRTTNKKRNIDTECMWKQSPEFLERVRQYLVEAYPYNAFCDECMGSNNELKLMETKVEDAVADDNDDDDVFDDDRRY